MRDDNGNEMALTERQPAKIATVETAATREMAEVQGMIVLAKKFPRDERAAMDRILNACQRPSLAEVALYEYSRGGVPITGPTIRVAEMLAQNWGNIQFGIRELEQRNGESTVEAFAWDLETNTRQTKVFQVPHLRYSRSGTKVLTDPRDIYENVANQGARRLRACILGVIPGDVVDAATGQCEETMKANVEITPELIKSLIDGFAKFGVSKEQLELRLQRRIDTITPAQVVGLRKVYNSLKDRMSSPADWFQQVEGAPDAPKPAENGGSKLAGKLKDKPKPKPKPKPKTPVQDEMPIEDSDDGEARSELINRLAEYWDEDIPRFSAVCDRIGIDSGSWETAPIDALSKLHRLVEQEFTSRG